MPRKLKTFQTSIGFYDLAVAAPSMKAAAEAWGADPDIFRKGHAAQTEDPAIVKATTAVPGVVLRRPVGSEGKFAKTAALPKAPKARKSKGDEAERMRDEREQRRRRQIREKADAALDRARKRHKAALRSFDDQRDEIARAEARENARWQDDQQKHREALEKSAP